MVLVVRVIARRRRKPIDPEIDPAVLRARALIAIRDLAVESDGAFIAGHKVLARLGQSPGLPVALETLLNEGLTEWGPAEEGGWGQRPTEAGYAEAAKLTSGSS